MRPNLMMKNHSSHQTRRVGHRPSVSAGSLSQQHCRDSAGRYCTPTTISWLCQADAPGAVAEELAITKSNICININCNETFNTDNSTTLNTGNSTSQPSKQANKKDLYSAIYIKWSPNTKKINTIHSVLGWYNKKELLPSALLSFFDMLPVSKAFLAADTITSIDGYAYSMNNRQHHNQSTVTCQTDFIDFLSVLLVSAFVTLTFSLCQH